MHNCFHVHEPPPPSRPVRPSPSLPTPPPSSSLGAAMKMLLFHHLAGVISVKCLSLGCRLVEGLVRLVGIRSSCLAMFFFHFDWVQSPSRLHLTFQWVQTFLPYYYFSSPPTHISSFSSLSLTVLASFPGLGAISVVQYQHDGVLHINTFFWKKQAWPTWQTSPAMSNIQSVSECLLSFARSLLFTLEDM